MYVYMYVCVYTEFLSRRTSASLITAASDIAAFSRSCMTCVCMYMYVFACMCVYGYVCLYVCVCIYSLVAAVHHLRMHARVCMYMCMRM